MDFLRLKQSGIQRDFTGTLADAPEVFSLDEVAKFGLKSTISTLAFDPVQSLLAVGVYQNDNALGEVHVFGQKRVHVTFHLPRKASVKTLQLCDSKVIVLDSKNDITIFDLSEPAAPGLGYSPPGVVTAMRSDPCLDWLFLGLQTGEVIAYDLDREVLSPLRIPNFWRERAPKARSLPVASLALHPKDAGTLLIAYSEGAVIYSFKLGVVNQWLEFSLPPGAPGADTELAMIRTLRKPAITHALWHPTGTFVCTTHEDSVMVFWNPKDGSVVQARTLEDAGVHLPGGELPGGGAGKGISIRQPVFRVAWCSTSNPDDTSILIAGGGSMTMPSKGITMLDLGPTPNMLTSSAQVVAEHLGSPRRQRILPTPTQHDVVEFCVIPRTTPHYGGGHDPVAIVALLANGELFTLRFPDGTPISPAPLLNPSLVMQHPFATRVDVSAINRQRWLSMVRPRRQQGKEIIVGGVEHVKPLRRYENRTIVQSSHPNGTVRIWDIGHADEIENDVMWEIDAARVLQRPLDLQVACVSMAGSSAETAVGMESGEVVVFRWAKNTFFGQAPPEVPTSPVTSEGVRDVRMYADPEIKEGLIPACVLDQKCGSVAALKMSDVGFCAVAYQTGHLCILDMRGPAVIYHQPLSSLTSKESKRSSVSFRKSAQATSVAEKATCLEFGVMTLEGDGICPVLRTVTIANSYRILLHRPLRFTCIFVGSNHVSDTSIISLTPLNSDSGRRTWASPQAVANLREGIKTPGVIVAVSTTETKIFKPPTTRGASKSWGDEATATAAAVCELENYGICLSVLTSAGLLQNYSLPGLKLIGDPISLRHVFDTARIDHAKVLESGHVLGFTAEHECALVYQWGTGERLDARPKDTLYNPSTPPLPRPTISNLQWLAGTQFLSIPDLDLLIGGPDRPMSRKQQLAERAAAQAEKGAQRAAAVASSSAAASSSGGGEGVFAGMAKSMKERTEKLSFTTDTMDRLEESSASFAEDVSKFVSQQKRKALLGGLTGKWF
ncbi:lethal giant larvae like, C-terminal-domain-containing protein [Sphaerosporella brunnea]|uniref:Lethal giant larvae like, C-terminal-domain-containing protein n=1 Tax=Sphaerosporella brunnea TaxID=1250544 RepID=A0A5J5F997_9PEZI|nr:lethal giant larvae like, C-terminal-domain-containing protein [Sphaerosporella brunnea]